jgi:AraC-like DNA-binding protein
MPDPYATSVTGSALLPDTHSFVSADLDEARAVLRRFYYPLAVDAPDGTDGFELGTEVIQLGPLTVGQLHFGSAVTLVAPEVDAYHVTLPVTGRVLVRHRGQESTAEPSATAAVFNPGTSVYTLRGSGSVEVSVKIERPALEAELAAMLGREIRGTLDLPSVLNTADGPGLSWSRMVRLLHDEYDHRQGLLYHPIIADQLRHGIISGLLLNYRDELTAPAPAGPPRAIRRVIDAVHDEPEKSFTVTDLATIGRMSVRSLQEGFRRHLGTAPMSYVQQVRLDRAHQTLLQGDTGRLTVASVAHQWGFAHLGRFACAYRARFGVSPSETLRSGR